MDFLIELDDGRNLTYSTDPCKVAWENGERIDLSRFAYQYFDVGAADNDQIAFSPEAPVIGKVQPRVLKIQLGLGCNYSCSYCSQGGQVEESTSREDAAEFLAKLDTWLHDEPDKIEFWGGEPTLYWKKLEILAPELRRRFQKARMSMVTNGTLLTIARAQWLLDLGFTIAVSHDGPGQSLRGDDPFENGEWTETMRAIFKLFGERICFNSVITPKNYDLLQIILWFEDRMGFEVKVNVEDVVTDYGTAKWSPTDLAAMAKSIRGYVSTGMAMFFPRLRWAAQQFMESLAVSKPLGGSHQVCGMDRPDQLAVDLNGSVLTCQNAGAESGHRIGSIQNLDAVRLDTSRSWASRPHCHECPVVHLCYGSCMFLKGQEFESSCLSSYHYNTAILSGVIKLLSGAEVKSISGWKPRKIIPIEVLS